MAHLPSRVLGDQREPREEAWQVWRFVPQDPTLQGPCGLAATSQLKVTAPSKVVPLPPPLSSDDRPLPLTLRAWGCKLPFPVAPAYCTLFSFSSFHFVLHSVPCGFPTSSINCLFKLEGATCFPARLHVQGRNRPPPDPHPPPGFFWPV